MIDSVLFQHCENGTAAIVPVFDAWKSNLYRIRKTVLSPVPPLLASIVIPQNMHYNNTQQQFLFCNSSTPHKVILHLHQNQHSTF